MGRPTGYDFNDAIRLQLGKSSHDVAVDFPHIKFERFRESGMVVPRNIPHRGIRRGAVDFHPSQLKPAGDITLGP